MKSPKSSLFLIFIFNTLSVRTWLQDYLISVRFSKILFKKTLSEASHHLYLLIEGSLTVWI